MTQSITTSTAPEADSVPKYTRKDFASDQDIRWCPGCGDYSILDQMQRILVDTGIRQENVVFVSGLSRQESRSSGGRGSPSPSSQND